MTLDSAREMKKKPSGRVWTPNCPGLRKLQFKEGSIYFVGTTTHTYSRMFTPVLVTLCFVSGGIYASMCSCSGTSAWSSMLAAPLPCSITSASSFLLVECQPTLSPGFSLTDPPRIPLVCGAPFNKGQSPPPQFNANVVGSRFALCSCAASTKQITITAPNVAAQIVFAWLSQFLLLGFKAPPSVPTLPRADNRGICQKVLPNPNRT